MKNDLFYLRKLFSKPFCAARAGGQTNRNYIVTLGKKKFFVRLPWEGMIDRRVEGNNILTLSQNKKLKPILPRYFLYILGKRNILNPKDRSIFSVPDGTMVSEYIPGREFTLRMFSQKKYQESFARLFHLFHTSGLRFHNSYNVFQDEIQKYRLAAVRYPLEKFFTKQIIAKLKALEKEAEQRLRGFARGVSTHNDVIFQNILVAKNNKMYLLDFEYAGLNKKGGIFYDLGYMFRDSFFNPPRMNKKTFERFLSTADKAYKKKLDRDQIYWAVIAALLVGIWWGVLRYFGVPRKERAYFHRYIQMGTQGLFELINELKKEGARV